MRVTLSQVPENKIDDALVQYYDLDSKLDNKLGYQNGNIRELVKKSIQNDYGYDVYSLFENPKEENFMDYEDIYKKRMNDFSAFFINAFHDTVQEDIDKISTLKEFTKSKLYESICSAIPDNVERCKKLMELLGGDKNNPSQSPSFYNQNYDKDSNINNRMNYMSQLSNALGDKDEKQKLMDAGASKKELEDIEKALVNGGMQAGKGSSQIYKQAVQIMRHLDLSKYLSINLGSKLDITGTFESPNELESSKLPIDGFGVRTIKNSSEATRAMSSELAMDDDIFYARFANNDLVVRDYLAKRKKAQAFYVLVDVSGSMGGMKAVFARSVIIEMLNRVIKGQAKYFIRTFDDSCGDLHTATTKEEAEKVSNYLQNVDFCGGGTDIGHALNTALADLKRDKAKFEDVDILIITDGESYINTTKKDMLDYRLHSFVIEHGYNAKKSESTKENLKKKKDKGQLTNDNGDLGKLYYLSDTFDLIDPAEEIKSISKYLHSGLLVNRMI